MIKMDVMNQAFLMTLDVEYKFGSKSLWCEVMGGKYGKREVLQNSLEAKSNDSFIWKTFAKVWPNLALEERWRVGNGAMINAWSDI